MSNKRLAQLLRSKEKELKDGDFLDCYNQTFIRGVSGTILTGISFRNMHYVIEFKDTASH